jgi:hypothetical protein
MGLLYLYLYIRTLYIYVSKDVRMHGYFLKPQGVREQNVLETLLLCDYRRADSSAVVPYCRVINCVLR